MKYIKRIILLIAVVFATTLQAQTKTFNSQLRVKQVPLSSSLDSLVTINASGLLTYLPKSELATEAQTLSFSNGQLTISDANTIDLDTYYYSQTDVDGLISDSAGALEFITENGSTGIAIKGRNPDNYGDIGEGAVDLSFSNSTSFSRGATGNNSVAAGYNTTASGQSSIAFGESTIASGQRSTASGYFTTASGYYSLSGGYFMSSPSYAETSFGVYGTTYSPDAVTGFSLNDRLFNLGNGTGTNNRSDALTVYKSGNATLNGDLTVGNIIGNGSQLTDLNASQVGLDNVNNTSDLDKPISTATQSALDNKIDIDGDAGTLNELSSKNISLGESYARNLRGVFIEDGATYFPNSSGNSKAKELQTGLKPTIALYPNAVKASVLYNNSKDRLKDFTVTRSTTATYVDEDGIIQTAGINVPRLDYSDGGDPKVLLENESTNYITYSEDFTNAAWTRGGSGDALSPVITSNVEVAPNGTLTADRVYFDLGANAQSSNRSVLRQTTSISNSTNKVISFWAKSNNGVNQNIFGYAGSTEFPMITVTSEWERFVFTADNIIDTSFGIELRNISPNNETTSDILVWGFQVEEGDFASSYIPTSGAIATRDLDIVGNAGNVNTFNDSEGTIFFEGAKTKEVRDCRISLNDGSGNNRLTIIFYEEGNIITTLSVSNGGNEPSLVYNSNPSFDNTENNKYALSYGSEGQKLFINGVLVDSDSNPLTFMGLSDLDLRSAAASSLNFFGTARDYRYYNRALSNEELINLTN